MPSIQPKQSATSTALVQLIDVTPVPFLAIRIQMCVAVDALSTSQISNALSSAKNTASVWTIDMAAAYGSLSEASGHRTIRPTSRTTRPLSGPGWHCAGDWSLHPAMTLLGEGPLMARGPRAGVRGSQQLAAAARVDRVHEHKGFDAEAATWDDDPGHEARQVAVARVIEEVVDLNPRMSVLDVGGGTGRLSILLV